MTEIMMRPTAWALRAMRQHYAGVRSETCAGQAISSVCGACAATPSAAGPDPAADARIFAPSAIRARCRGRCASSSSPSSLRSRSASASRTSAARWTAGTRRKPSSPGARRARSVSDDASRSPFKTPLRNSARLSRRNARCGSWLARRPPRWRLGRQPRRTDWRRR